MTTTTPTFTTKIDGKDIVVILRMSGKSQEFALMVWTQYGPIFHPTAEQMQTAKAIVDNNIASMTAQEFATWMRSAKLTIQV